MVSGGCPGPSLFWERKPEFRDPTSVVMGNTLAALCSGGRPSLSGLFTVQTQTSLKASPGLEAFSALLAKRAETPETQGELSSNLDLLTL